MPTEPTLTIVPKELDDILRMIHILLEPDEAGPGFYLQPDTEEDADVHND